MCRSCSEDCFRDSFVRYLHASCRYICTRRALSLSISLFLSSLLYSPALYADPRGGEAREAFKQLSSRCFCKLDRSRASFRTNICYSTTAPSNFGLPPAFVRPSVRHGSSVRPYRAPRGIELIPRKFNSHAYRRVQLREIYENLGWRVRYLHVISARFLFQPHAEPNFQATRALMITLR